VICEWENVLLPSQGKTEMKMSKTLKSQHHLHKKLTLHHIFHSFWAPWMEDAFSQKDATQMQQIAIN